jgi:hypothetical protein
LIDVVLMIELPGFMLKDPLILYGSKGFGDHTRLL